MKNTKLRCASCARRGEKGVVTMLTVNSFSSDALVIFVDYHSARGGTSRLKENLERLLTPNQWVYSDGTEDGQQLMNRIDTMQNRRELSYFPRLVFLHDVCVTDLDEARMVRYKDIMSTFYRGLQPGFPNDHIHLTFMRYQNGDGGRMSPENKEGISNRIRSFWDGSLELEAAHLEFICYRQPMQPNFESQEEAMAYLAYLMTKGVFWRSGGFGGSIPILTGRFCMIRENHFSAVKVNEYTRKIEELGKWLFNESDPDLNQFYMELDKKMNDWYTAYEIGHKKREDRKGLYPYPVSNYTQTKKFFCTTFTRDRDDYERRLQSEQQKYCKMYLDGLLGEQVHDWVKHQDASMSYRTFKTLKTAWDGGTVKSHIRAYLDSKELRPEEKADFAKVMCEYVQDFLEERHNEEQRQKKQDELSETQRKFDAIPFKNLADWAANLLDFTRYLIPAGVGVADKNRWALLEPGQDPLSGMDENDIYIRGEGLLDDNQIVYIRLGTCTDENPVNILNY